MPHPKGVADPCNLPPRWGERVGTVQTGGVASLNPRLFAYELSGFSGKICDKKEGHKVFFWMRLQTLRVLRKNLWQERRPQGLFSDALTNPPGSPEKSLAEIAPELHVSFLGSFSGHRSPAFTQKKE